MCVGDDNIAGCGDDYRDFFPIFNDSNLSPHGEPLEYCV